MPVQFGSDENGCFARWGNSGRKYRYKCGNMAGKERAKNKAADQGAAIIAQQKTNKK